MCRSTHEDQNFIFFAGLKTSSPGGTLLSMVERVTWTVRPLSHTNVPLLLLEYCKIMQFMRESNSCKVVSAMLCTHDLNRTLLAYSMRIRVHVYIRIHMHIYMLLFANETTTKATPAVTNNEADPFSDLAFTMLHQSVCIMQEK